MNRLFLLLTFFIFISSCIIQLNTGNSYEYLNQDEKNRIQKLTSFDLTDTSHIYEITGPQLMEELKKHDRSLVYSFVSGCSSKNCAALSVVENYAKENDLKLFLILARYLNLDETLVQHPKSILYAINTDYYGSIKYNEYLPLFTEDLSIYEFSKGEKYPGNYIFYQGDSIVKIKKNLFEE